MRTGRSKGTVNSSNDNSQSALGAVHTRAKSLFMTNLPCDRFVGPGSHTLPECAISGLTGALQRLAYAIDATRA